MRTKISSNYSTVFSSRQLRENFKISKSMFIENQNILPEIVFITSYPPRECGIATYSQDLIFALNNKFEKSFDIKICALENQNSNYFYNNNVDYVLETDNHKSYLALAGSFNQNQNISMVLIQHEFGLFKSNESDFINLLQAINKPIIVVFHTVLPNPNDFLKENVLTLRRKIVERESFIERRENLLLVRGLSSHGDCPR